MRYNICGITSKPRLQFKIFLLIGLEIGELITNRFGELLDVEPQGKLTTTWGNLKSSE